MTTCMYCDCEIAPRDAGWGEDINRHRDAFLCIKALKRRVAELETELSYIKYHPAIEDMDD